jgi:hypothetical protein
MLHTSKKTPVTNTLVHCSLLATTRDDDFVKGKLQCRMENFLPFSSIFEHAHASDMRGKSSCYSLCEKREEKEKRLRGKTILFSSTKMKISYTAQLTQTNGTLEHFPGQ